MSGEKLELSSYDVGGERFGPGGCAGDFGGRIDTPMCDERAVYLVSDSWCDLCGVGTNACGAPFVHAAIQIDVPLCARHTTEVRTCWVSQQAVMRIRDLDGAR